MGRGLLELDFALHCSNAGDSEALGGDRDSPCCPKALLLATLPPTRPKPIPDPRAAPIVDNPRLEGNDRLDVIDGDEEDEEVGSTGREERHRIDLRGVGLDRMVEVRARCRTGVDREREDILR